MTTIHSTLTSDQISWSRPNVEGHSKLSDGSIDQTEGFGAFDSVFNKYSLGKKDVRVIDVGGGQHDANSKYVKNKFGINLSVFDPFMRSKAHNEKVLRKASLEPFDGAVSFSVLNVIDQSQARIQHIQRCFSSITKGSQAFFKVWPGDGSGIEEVMDGGYQSNRSIHTYVREVEKVFGKENVTLDEGIATIIATKQRRSLNMMEVG